MPNGGIMPSCHACKWASRIETETNDIHFPMPIFKCQLHGITIYLGFECFCSELTGRHEGWFLGLMEKIHEELGRNIEQNRIYAWIEVHDNYDHDVVMLAEVQDYATWNEEKTILTWRKLAEQHREDKLDEEE